MQRPRFYLPLIAVATGLCPGIASAHPVPKREHLRAIELRLRPDELCVQYVLEVDEWTAVFLDMPALFAEAELRTMTKPSQFYDAYLRRLAPLLADQLLVTLNDDPLTLRCVEQRYDVLDHLRCEFLFQVNWSPTPGTDHRVEFRDTTYDREVGRIRLALTAAEAITVTRRQVPGSLLQSRPPTDLRPGDDEKLRTARATFRLTTEPNGLSAEVSSLPPPAASRQAGSSMLTLLDSPYGFGGMLLLAVAFGAAHALTPGHGKTLVAAYLVAERGTVWHALSLGLTTTLSHTGSVLILAVVLTQFFPNAEPGRVQTAVGFFGGLIIAAAGLWLLLRRLGGRADHVHVMSDHKHNADGTVTYIDRPGWARLIMLGIGGGIVPCWDAILLLLICYRAGRMSEAVPLLLAFSAGLAGVLIALGVAVVYGKGLGDSRWGGSRAWQALPKLSAVAVLALGLWMCRDSLTPPPG
jgi:ABC-type nickel/cobalt efflux system permease component RcnA